MRFAMVAAVLAALVAAPAMAQKGKKIQCWTDKNGARMCGDRIPPEYAGEKRDVIKDGRVIDTIDASKTEDERKAEEARKKAEAERQKQAEHDRTLLELYRSQSDITAMRDERLALIDSRTQAAEKNAADTDKALAGLRARAEALQKDNKPVDAKLAKQIKQFEQSQEQNAKALERYRKERESLQAKFDRDYVRYSELRGLPATAPPPPPASPAEKAAAEKAAAEKAAAEKVAAEKKGAPEKAAADKAAATPAQPATPPAKTGS